MKTKLFLIRHGLSEANVDEALYLTQKDHEIKLAHKGVAQAKACGNALLAKFKAEKISEARVYVSPYQRTRETWENIKLAFDGIDIDLMESENPLIREQEYKHFKDLPDMEKKKLRKKEYSPFYYRFKNAESQADVYLRVQTFLNHLRLARIETSNYQPIVIVAHEVVLRMVVGILKNSKIEDMGISIDNCEILELEF